MYFWTHAMQNMENGKLPEKIMAWRKMRGAGDSPLHPASLICLPSGICMLLSLFHGPGTYGTRWWTLEPTALVSGMQTFIIGKYWLYSHQGVCIFSRSFTLRSKQTNSHGSSHILCLSARIPQSLWVPPCWPPGHLTLQGDPDRFLSWCVCYHTCNNS
jgi:hypothetical protein